LRLEARVTLWLLALLGAAAVVTLAGLAVSQTHSVQHQSREAGYLVARSIENTLEVSMLNNAQSDIRQAVTNVPNGTYVSSVGVYGRAGLPWVTSDNGQLAGTQQAALNKAIGTGQPQSSSSGDQLTVFVPVQNQDQCHTCHVTDPAILGAVGVTINQGQQLGDFARSTRNSLLIAAVPLILGLGLSVWAVRRTVLRPLAMVGDASDKIAQGDLSTRLPDMGAGEFQAVATAFNDMASRLELQAADLNETVDELQSDLESMEELQTLLMSGAGLNEILSRTAGHLGPAVGASGVAIWRHDQDERSASWGRRQPPDEAWEVEDIPGIVRTSGGALRSVPASTPLAWAIVPASRRARMYAQVGVVWEPPRPLLSAERDLLVSLAGLVAIAVENAELLERLHAEEETLQAVLKKTLTAQEDERRRVARELHDDTSQILHALLMNIDLLEKQLRDSPEKARIKAVKSMAEQAGENLDKILFDLRPALLDELGLFPALRWYASQLRDAFACDIEFETENPRRLPEIVEVAAFRIVQEALSNAAHHANSQHIWARLSAEPGTLVAIVRDDGEGFDTTEAAGRARSGEAVGLLGMRERTELLGGELEIESKPGEGTTVTARIPLPDEGGEGAEKVPGTAAGERE
jgi:signal transduction histidine kinase/HAMP domain-containing protein